MLEGKTGAFSQQPAAAACKCGEQNGFAAGRRVKGDFEKKGKHGAAVLSQTGHKPARSAPDRKAPARQHASSTRESNRPAGHRLERGRARPWLGGALLPCVCASECLAPGQISEFACL